MMTFIQFSFFLVWSLYFRIQVCWYFREGEFEGGEDVSFCRPFPSTVASSLFISHPSRQVGESLRVELLMLLRGTFSEQTLCFYGFCTLSTPSSSMFPEPKIFVFEILKGGICHLSNGPFLINNTHLESLLVWYMHHWLWSQNINN